MKVHIIGAGLLGTSLGLALNQAGHDVSLADTSPVTLALAQDMGAGSAGVHAEPEVIVVATPPDVAAFVIVEALRTWPAATVTDVASVKGGILERVRSETRRAELDRYIGSHPMAGREKSGAIAARADLFVAKPWVVCSDDDTPPERLAQVIELAHTVGAVVVHLDPVFHDSSVARISHAPQVLASVLAAQLITMPAEGVALAGQGLRDTTRIADSDPRLWTQILAGNAAEVREVLTAIRTDLDRVIDALDLGPGGLKVLAGTLANGNEGRSLIPGKHGQAPTVYARINVIIDDTPGALAQLFADVRDLGVNVEDMRMDHATGVKLGSVELSVLPASARHLEQGLTQRGWRIPEPVFGIGPAEVTTNEEDKSDGNRH